MIGIYTRLKIKEGRGNSFESTAKNLVEGVRENELNNCFYHLFKENDNVYVFLEAYENEEAFEDHKTTTHYKEAGGLIKPLLDSHPETIILTGII